MKIAILANCQGFAIKKILLENFVNIEFLDIPLIFTILNNDEEKEKVFNQLDQADFILMQPLKDRFGILSLNNIKKEFSNKVISFPVLYFRFYHPEIIYLRSYDKSSIKSFFIDYHDVNIIYGYLKNKSALELYQQRQNLSKVYDEDFYEYIWIESLKSLHGNEKDCDIVISDYIAKYGRINKLFHVVNHPTNTILNLLVQRIMGKLGKMKNHTFIKNELLSNVIAPTNPLISAHMSEFKHVKNDVYRIRNQEYRYIEMVEKYYEFYMSLDKGILEMNIFDSNDSMIKKIIS